MKNNLEPSPDEGVREADVPGPDMALIKRLGDLEQFVAEVFNAERELDRARLLERGDYQSRDTVVRAERAYDAARFRLKRAIPQALLETSNG